MAPPIRVVMDAVRRRLAPRPFGWAPPLTLILFLGPIIAGVLGTLLPAFGFHPSAPIMHVGLDAFAALFRDPSFPAALRVTLISGLGSAVCAVSIGFGVAIAAAGTPYFAWARAALAPALAFPYASFAVGFSFVLAPSGWLARLFSPWATGWALPPDILLLRDPDGFSLLAAMALKECLFMLLMITGALGQVDAPRLLRTARSMGYSVRRAWLFVVLPQIYPLVRLPIYAILAASFSVVDVALILGPTAPPPLAPLTLEWYGLFQPEAQMRAAASSVFQMALIAAIIGLWRLCEIGAGRICEGWSVSGHRRGMAENGLAVIGGAGMAMAVGTAFLSALVLFLWSFAQRWSWPSGLPESWSLDAWASSSAFLLRLTVDTLLIGGVAALFATILAILCLEAGTGTVEGRRRARWLWLIYIPLLLPQIGFLYGVQIVWARVGMDGSYAAVIWTHLLFVLPYIFLILSDNFHALDPRLSVAARSLGASRWRSLWSVKLPLLAKPVAVAAAVGFAVSAGQYLPTVFAGGGRIETLATQAVALASGADRRIGGVVAFVLTLLPFLALLSSQIVPDLVWRRGKDGRI